MIPAPGGMGTYQFLVSEALAIYQIPGEGSTFHDFIFSASDLFHHLFGVWALS